MRLKDKIQIVKYILTAVALCCMLGAGTQLLYRIHRNIQLASTGSTSTLNDNNEIRRTLRLIDKPAKGTSDVQKPATPPPPKPVPVQENKALLEAALQGNEDAVRQALKKGAQINVRDRNGKTALILAAENGHLPIIQLLLDKGADINMKAYNGKTALSVAAAQGHEKVVETLAKAGSVLK